jgi:hypothetical protein
MQAPKLKVVVVVGEGRSSSSSSSSSSGSSSISIPGMGRQVPSVTIYALRKGSVVKQSAYENGSTFCICICWADYNVTLVCRVSHEDDSVVPYVQIKDSNARLQMLLSRAVSRVLWPTLTHRNASKHSISNMNKHTAVSNFDARSTAKLLVGCGNKLDGVNQALLKTKSIYIYISESNRQFSLLLKYN